MKSINKINLQFKVLLNSVVVQSEARFIHRSLYGENANVDFHSASFFHKVQSNCSDYKNGAICHLGETVKLLFSF